MFKRNSTVKLLATLGILIGIYFIISLTKNTQRSKSLRKELVSINDDKVDKLVIQKSGRKTLLEKEGEDWVLTLDNGRKVKTKDAAVKNAIGSLMTVKPSRLVARTEEKWKEYQVDSAGYQVQVYEGGNKTLDLVIGRLGVEGQRSFHTFVRLEEDNETYRANNFMSFSVPSDPSGYRNGQLMQLKKDSIRKISFNYDIDPFVLEKSGNNWLIQGNPTDSAAVVTYLGDISFVTSSAFIDDVDNYEQSTASITYYMNDGSETTIEAFVDGESKVLKSSDNLDEMVNDSTLHAKLFKSKESFR